MAQTVLEMTKELVGAQIIAKSLSPENMQQALREIHASLLKLKHLEDTGTLTAEALPRAGETPLAWRKSIRKHVVMCLECGLVMRQLSAGHLSTHGLDRASYKAKYGIPRSQPLAAKEVTARRREVVQTTKPWERTPRFIQAQERQVAQDTRVSKSRKRTPRRKKGEA